MIYAIDMLLLSSPLHNLFNTPKMPTKGQVLVDNFTGDTIEFLETSADSGGESGKDVFADGSDEDSQQVEGCGRYTNRILSVKRKLFT